MNPFMNLARQAGNWYVRRICRAESYGQNSTHQSERLIEYQFALERLAAVRPKTVLDVGTYTSVWHRPLPTCGFLATAIDNVGDYWDPQMVNPRRSVLDVDITKPGEFRGPFGPVTCVGVIHHIVDHETAPRNMLWLLASGGLLTITTLCNHCGHCPNVCRRPFREGDRGMAATGRAARAARIVATFQRSRLGHGKSHCPGGGAVGRRAAPVGMF